ncbi:hypothetical protein KKD19_04925 [Patescibacteria group bacterium]|nr:hypothetical protein [Patescibacteria group bacterium]MBU4512553.1 hypothetical protein [Patescibacteria group bacterium]
MKFINKDKKEGVSPPGFGVEQKAEVETKLQPFPEIKAKEFPKEKKSKAGDKPQAEQEGPSTTVPSAQAPSSTPPPLEPKSETMIKIENILEEGMAEAYKSMDPVIQYRFRTEGEQTARKIEQIIRGVKVKVKEVLNLIRRWLLIIPGVNKFFIEQETKIKADKIMALREK